MQNLHRTFFPCRDEPPPAFFKEIFDLVANTCTIVPTYKIDNVIDSLERSYHACTVSDDDYSTPFPPFPTPITTPDNDPLPEYKAIAAAVQRHFKPVAVDHPGPVNPWAFLKPVASDQPRNIKAPEPRLRTPQGAPRPLFQDRG